MSIAKQLHNHTSRPIATIDEFLIHTLAAWGSVLELDENITTTCTLLDRALELNSSMCMEQDCIAKFLVRRTLL